MWVIMTALSLKTFVKISSLLTSSLSWRQSNRALFHLPRTTLRKLQLQLPWLRGESTFLAASFCWTFRVTHSSVQVSLTRWATKCTTIWANRMQESTSHAPLMAAHCSADSLMSNLPIWKVLWTQPCSSYQTWLVRSNLAWLTIETFGLSSQGHSRVAEVLKSTQIWTKWSNECEFLEWHAGSSKNTLRDH